MYRIAFQTKGAYWVVQLLQWGFIWNTVEDSKGEPLQFDTYDHAREFTDTQGFPKAYEEQVSYSRHMMNGART